MSSQPKTDEAIPLARNDYQRRSHYPDQIRLSKYNDLFLLINNDLSAAFGSLPTSSGFLPRNTLYYFREKRKTVHRSLHSGPNRNGNITQSHAPIHQPSSSAVGGNTTFTRQPNIQKINAHDYTITPAQTSGMTGTFAQAKRVQLFAAQTRFTQLLRCKILAGLITTQSLVNREAFPKT